MRNIWIIAKREFDHYFISPIAYVVAFLILFVIGILFAINIYFYIQNALQSFGQTPEVTIITGVFGFLLVLSVPAITMRLLAEEARMGTLELLLTAPIRDFDDRHFRRLPKGLERVLNIEVNIDRKEDPNDK